MYTSISALSIHTRLHLRLRLFCRFFRGALRPVWDSFNRLKFLLFRLRIFLLFFSLRDLHPFGHQCGLFWNREFRATIVFCDAPLHVRIEFPARYPATLMMTTTVVVGVVVRCLVVRRAGECGASRASIASLRARGHIVQVLFLCRIFPRIFLSRLEKKSLSRRMSSRPAAGRREKRRDHHPGANNNAAKREEEKKR